MLGDAALKYRLLQSRGYVVVPVDCREWDGRNGDTKALYIQQMIDRLAAATQARAQSRAGAAGTGEAKGTGGGLPRTTATAAAAGGRSLPATVQRPVLPSVSVDAGSRQDTAYGKDQIKRPKV